jgi:hypothetical protein
MYILFHENVVLQNKVQMFMYMQTKVYTFLYSCNLIITNLPFHENEVLSISSFYKKQLHEFL